MRIHSLIFWLLLMTITQFILFPFSFICIIALFLSAFTILPPLIFQVFFRLNQRFSLLLWRSPSWAIPSVAGAITFESIECMLSCLIPFFLFPFYFIFKFLFSFFPIISGGFLSSGFPLSVLFNILVGQFNFWVLPPLERISVPVSWNEAKVWAHHSNSTW